MKRVLAMLLAVMLLACFSGAGALMELTTYEDAVLLQDSDSGEAPSEPDPSEPDAPLPGDLTQQQVNEYIAGLFVELKGFEGNAPESAEAIWNAAERLIALPRAMARRAPDFNAVNTLLDSLARATGQASVSVVPTEAARAIGIGADTVELLGAAVLSGINGGAPVAFLVDVKQSPSNRLPSDVTGRNMVVLELSLMVNGLPEQPVLPITVAMPFPSAARRSNAVLLHYQDGTSSPQYIWPSIQFIGDRWRMSFTVERLSEFVLANYVERPTSSTTGQDAEESRIYSYWQDVMGKIESAEAGDDIYTNAKSAGARYVPATVLEALYGKNVTLHIEFGGVQEIVVNGKAMRPVPVEKVFYTFWELVNLYHQGAEPDELPDPDMTVAQPLESYVQTVGPPANSVQQIPPQKPRQSASEDAAASVEEVSSREESREETAAPANAAPEMKPVSVQAPAAAREEKQGWSIPIWAPAAIAGGILLGLGAGVLVARLVRRRKARKERFYTWI